MTIHRDLACGPVTVRLRRLPAGSFTMGGCDGAPRRRVTLTRPFALGLTAVTVGQFAAFVAATGHVTTAEARGTATVMRDGVWVEVPGPTWRDPGFAQGDDHPVTVVSWPDAVACCAWMSTCTGCRVRLPSEAEREYACRAGTDTVWSFGDDEACLGEYAWYRANTGAGTPTGGTRPVATRRPNPWGLYDLHGNVIEWCADWFTDDLTRLPDTDPSGPATGTRRVLRGGCWDFGPGFGRSGNRGHLPPDYRFGFVTAQAAADTLSCSLCAVLGSHGLPAIARAMASQGSMPFLAVVLR